jgi:DNA gyrase subunit A
LTPDTYKSQKRGGKGVSGGETKEGDFIEHAFLCNTHDELLLFTNRGKVFNLRIFEIPEYGRTAKGLPLVNLVQLEQNEVINSVLTRGPKGTISQNGTNGLIYKYFMMVTQKGIIKKTAVEEFAKIRTNGLTAIKLEEGDELSWIKPTTGEDDVLIITTEGKSVRFKESDVRPMGRSTRGVTAIKFKTNTDLVIGMGIIRSDENKLLTLSQKGFGKMSFLKEYPLQKRGGSGVWTFRVTPKTGKISSARLIDDGEEEVVVISENSKVTRTEIEAIPILGRQTSGVKIMNIDGDDAVATVAVI